MATHRENIELFRAHAAGARREVIDGTARHEACAFSRYADITLTLAELVEKLADDLEVVYAQQDCKHEEITSDGWGSANWRCVECNLMGRYPEDERIERESKRA